ncbi:lysine--tRNA ligase [Candidatus Micrarchaeota archaeon]|nr:lysine--tRNA ligase [Candidatus Micrarchaeota archaeon]MBU1930831.1 lysine--tRNA ligase [Candidatus Micrarchaeota archaeon]
MSTLQKEKNLESRPWAEEVADQVLKRKQKSFVCEGMWTPSGFFHIGNARPEIFTPYAVKKAIEERKKPVQQNFIIDDFDAVRKIPEDLNIPEKQHEKYLGFPCATAPSPIPGYTSWAEAFTSNIRKFIPQFGVKLNITSAFETYKKGKFNDLIVFSLNHSKEIVQVWSQVSGSEKATKGFVPIQILCEKCKRIYYTNVTKWDGKKVSYECDCGQKGTVSPLNGNAKLHWRVHWAAHWILNKVDFESAGKDHFSKGGSVDVGQALMKEVFKKKPPIQVPTEFIQIGGAKMSGSVGNVINLEQWLEVASPELFRFLNFSYKPNSVIEFSLTDNSFILLNDRFDRCERIYYDLEEAETKSMTQKLKRVYELSLIEKPGKRILQVHYPFLANIAQLFDPKKQLEQALEIFIQTKHLPKGLSTKEKGILQQKLERAQNWVNNWAPESYKISFLETMPSEVSFSPEQRKTLDEISRAILKEKTPEAIQKAIFDISRNNTIEPKQSFKAIYQIVLGKKFGPKVGNLAFAFGKEKIAKRLQEASNTH